MEEKSVKSLLMVCLVLSLLLGQSTASFKKCYRKFVDCVMNVDASLLLCAAKCVKDCIFHFPSAIPSSPQNYCKLGCATSLCTHLSTKEDPGEEKVEACVDSCSNTC
ncbi:LOW QUALITY PROTEIN: hypothetical protein CFOL_v3_16157, partial [Cephalotus follicularis]